MDTRDNNIEQNKIYLRNNKLYKEYYFKYAPNDNEETLYSFFEKNGLLNENNLNYIFKIMYNKNTYKYIYISKYINNEYRIYDLLSYQGLFHYEPYNDISESKISSTILSDSLKYYKTLKAYNIASTRNFESDDIQEDEAVNLYGGYAKSSKFKTKEVLGKLRRVYKIPNSKKEHIMHKGILITLSEYKAVMKLKNKK